MTPTSASSEGKHACKALTKAGKPCRAAAMSGGYCYFHGNPDLVRELGRKGGQRNRRAIAPALVLPEKLSVKHVRAVLAQAISDLRSRKMPPRTASALAQLSGSLLYIIELTDIEARIEKLEAEVVADKESGTASDEN